MIAWPSYSLLQNFKLLLRQQKDRLLTFSRERKEQVSEYETICD